MSTEGDAGQLLLLCVAMGPSQPGVRDFRILLAWLELEEAAVSGQWTLDPRPGPECSVHGAEAGSCLPISHWRRGAPALCYLTARRLPARFQPAHLGKCWCCFKGGSRASDRPGSHGLCLHVPRPAFSFRLLSLPLSFLLLSPSRQSPALGPLSASPLPTPDPRWLSGQGYRER